MTYEEFKQHREALEEGDWLTGGEIIQLWNSKEGGYPLSFYVVAFSQEGDENRRSGTTVYCFRVFGGLEGEELFPPNVSVDQVAQFYEGLPMHLQNNPNWRPYEN